MKTPEKMLQKLLNKAEKLGDKDNVSISPDSLTEVTLEDFYNAKGKIFLKENTFYRETNKGSQEWLFYVMGISATPSMEERLQALEAWTHKFIIYVNSRFEKIEK